MQDLHLSRLSFTFLPLSLDTHGNLETITTPRMNDPTLLGIPPELRLPIYTHLLTSRGPPNAWHPLLVSCRLIYTELHPLLSKHATFTFTLSRRSQNLAKLDYDDHPTDSQQSRDMSESQREVVEQFTHYCRNFRNMVLRFEVEDAGNCGKWDPNICDTWRTCKLEQRLAHCWRIRKAKHNESNCTCGRVDDQIRGMLQRFAYLENGRWLHPMDTRSSDVSMALMMAFRLAKHLRPDLTQGSSWLGENSFHLPIWVEWVYLANGDEQVWVTDTSRDGLKFADVALIRKISYEPDLWNRKPDECLELFERAVYHELDTIRAPRCCVAMEKKLAEPVLQDPSWSANKDIQTHRQTDRPFRRDMVTFSLHGYAEV